MCPGKVVTFLAGAAVVPLVALVVAAGERLMTATTTHSKAQNARTPTVAKANRRNRRPTRQVRRTDPGTIVVGPGGGTVSHGQPAYRFVGDMVISR